MTTTTASKGRTRWGSAAKTNPFFKRQTHRSGLEDRIADQLTAAEVPYKFEPYKLAYTVPARDAKYTPDFDLNSRIIIESKGYFDTDDRQKMILVKQAHPELDIRLVFQRANSPIYKGSKTTYGKWADTHGFKWADKGVIPDEWIKEATK